MTNQEYEAASIAAAGCYDRFEGEHKLKQIDEHIAAVEKTLATLNELRRETVNQYNLNKGGYITDTKTYVVGERAAGEEWQK
jgi:hypothetical protein